MITYISTRGGGEPRTFEQVLLDGLAPDGGLYVPQSWPRLDMAALKGKSYIEVAEAVMFPFVEGSIEKKDFRRILEETYGPEIFRHKDVAPLHKVYDNVHALELFHGPTIAFKDVALQLLGRLFDHVLTRRNERVTIVGATSGDTGSAAIEGCRHSDRVNIFILHPHGRVSDVQRRQMTTVRADNVHNIALEGTFDDCQNLVKAMFNDAEFRAEMNLSAVNSINWARIMAQIVYYVTTVLALGEGVSFIVPTGNFGNVFAAYAARKMGVPIKSLIVATNENDILARFFKTGTMEAKDVHPTLSPSMDIQISSNFERYLFDVVGRDAEKLKALMEAFKRDGKYAAAIGNDFTAHRCDDVHTLAVIKNVYDETGYVLDPHSAVGMAAALEMKSLKEKSGGPIVTLATAHPAKFPDAVEKATGTRPALPPHLADLMGRPENFDKLPNDFNGLKSFIRKAS
ncbi:MAG TPA: threonine synthase [Rhodospirillaceae bacterium]|nr:threonine synthase [Rhodospirillaceae bacterium]